MTGFERLESAFEAFAAGRVTPEQDSVIRAAIAAGDVQIVTGERAAQIGRDANGATIVTGDRNIILSVGPGELASLLKAWAAGRRRVDHLPADLPDFEGRKAEIEKLCTALLEGGQAAITAIGGVGGIGKSALAVHVAHLLNDAAPDGRMGGTSGRPLSPAEAMVKVVAALHPESQAPQEEEAARQAYRAALDDKRVLVLLDNAEGSAQVRPLLDWRAPATMVIVTSRRTITAPGLQTMDLGVMEADEARAMLRSILSSRQPSDQELDQIAERCGRLPLALRVAATDLALNPHITIALCLARLANEKKRLRALRVEDDAQLDVYAVLGLSAMELARAKPELEARWRLLAVFPASFGTAAVAAVWEVEADQAEQGLGELRQRSMVLWDATDNRWRLHDLMRDVARLPLEGQDAAALAIRLDAARAHHAQHYCHVLAAANDLYLNGGEDVLAGLALFDLEQRNITAGQAWSAARIEADDAAAHLATDYANAGVYVLDLRLHPRERIVWLEAQRKACVRLRDRRREGSAINSLGTAWCTLGELQRAIECHEQALQIARQVGARGDEGNALGGLGLAWADRGEPRQAIGFYEQQLVIVREIGGQRDEAAVLGNMGNSWMELKEPQRAMTFYDQQLAIALGDPRLEGNALNSLGIASYELGDLQQAIKYYKRALKIARAIGDRAGEGNALGNLANAWRKRCKPRRATGFCEQALHVVREIGDRMGEGNALANWARALDQLGERAEAVRRAREALAIYEAIGAKHLVEKARAQLAAWGADDAPE